MTDNRDELINALYKKTFGKDYSKFGDIMQRYDKATGTLYCNSDSNETRYTSDQIASAQKYLRDALDKEQTGGKDDFFKIAVCAIKLLQEGEQQN